MRMWRASASAAALLAVVGVATTGCSDNDEGVSDSTTTTAVVEPWDPCSLSDAALRQAGLDPATEGPGSVEAAGEETCSWKNADIAVTATFTTAVTIEQLRNDPRSLEFREVKVGGRDAFTEISDLGGNPNDYCYLNVPLQTGLVTMQFSRSALSKDTAPMCEWAVNVGDALVGEIPD